jgi:ATP-dependent Clp protease ATP-binding subunit ClpX
MEVSDHHDTMFDLPSLEGVEEVVISKEVVEGRERAQLSGLDMRERGRDGVEHNCT